MLKLNVVRAWKDEEYRASLSQTEADFLPENPAGLIELPDDLLGNVVGGTEEAAGSQGGSCPIGTLGCCPTACGCTCKSKACPVKPPGEEYMW